MSASIRQLVMIKIAKKGRSALKDGDESIPRGARWSARGCSDLQIILLVVSLSTARFGYRTSQNPRKPAPQPSQLSSKTLLPKHPVGIVRCWQGLGVLEWIMSLAYRIVFECPNGHSINLQKKCSNVSLSETEAMKLFGDEKLSCSHANCGWQGKASEAKLRRILPFNWILAPAT